MGDEVQQWLAEGIARAKASQREQARELLLKVVECDERNAPAWLWLSSVVDSDADRRVALENVLEIEPQNAAARAGLDWLDRQAQAQALSPPTTEREEPPTESPAQDLSNEPVSEPDGCPYCGKPIAESDGRCPHCAQPLTTRALKPTDFLARVPLLVTAWLVQVVADLADGALILLALTVMAGASTGNALGIGYIHAYLVGAALVSGFLTADLSRAVLVFLAFDAIALAWSFVVATILPWRRSAAPAVALFVAALHVVLAMSSLAVGMSSLAVGAGRLLLALFIGFFLLEAHGDFAWQSVRHRLELDREAKSSMDCYSRGRYYRRVGQTAKAILHWERAAELAPARFEFRVALGNAYYALGLYDRAVEHLQIALRLKPDASDLRQFLDTITTRHLSS